MKQIRLMNWLVEVDVKKTKEFYRGNIELCDCLYCENYMDTCSEIDQTFMEIFAVLGIDPTKPSHLSEFGEVEDGVRLYIGSYHIVGKLVEGEFCTDSEWDDHHTYEMKNYTFGFEKEILFVHDDFPRPVLQIQFEARIPWVLNDRPGN